MTYPEILARIVGAGLASPVDLRTSWTIADVLDAVDALNWTAWQQREADRAAAKK